MYPFPELDLNGLQERPVRVRCRNVERGEKLAVNTAVRRCRNAKPRYCEHIPLPLILWR